jgi:hypothetical protein
MQMTKIVDIAIMSSKCDKPWNQQQIAKKFVARLKGFFFVMEANHK